MLRAMRRWNSRLRFEHQVVITHEKVVGAVGVAEENTSRDKQTRQVTNKRFTNNERRVLPHGCVTDSCKRPREISRAGNFKRNYETRTQSRLKRAQNFAHLTPDETSPRISKTLFLPCRCTCSLIVSTLVVT